MADDKNSNSDNSQSQGQPQNTTSNEPITVDQGLVDISQRGLKVDLNLVDLIQESKE